MTKQEYIGFSLGKGLKCLSTHQNYNGKVVIINGLCNRSNKTWVLTDAENGWMPQFELSEITPICRPLTDLTKPITQRNYNNGEPFVPAMKIAKIVANIQNDDLDSEWIIKDIGRIVCVTPWDLKIEIFYKTKEISFSIYDTWNHIEKRTINQLIAFQKLLSWHFNLMDEGEEFIDINTLDINPCK